MRSSSRIQGLAIFLIGLIETVVSIPEDKKNDRGFPPVIHEGPSPHIYFKAGNRIALPCRASGSPAPRYFWRRNGLHLETSNDTSTRHYVRDVLDSGLLHLKTSPLSTEGYYQCFATNDLGTSMSNVSFVQEAVFEDRKLHRKVNNVTVIEGSHLVMSCGHFISIPPATVQWYSADYRLERKKSSAKRIRSDERMFVDDHGNLILSVVTKSDEQVMFECHAYNYITGQTSIGSFFRMLSLPGMVKDNTVPELIYSSKGITAVSGMDVTLTCLFSSRPIARIVWSRKSGALLSQTVLYQNGQQHLKLKQVTLSDSDLYVCRSFNGFGETQATINLTVSEPLKASLTNRVMEAGKSVEFICASNNQISTDIHWFFNSQKINHTTLQLRSWNISGDKLMLHDITWNDTGAFACNISDSFSSITSNAYLVVTPLEPELYTDTTVDLTSLNSMSSNSTSYLCDSATCHIKSSHVNISETAIWNATLLDLQQQLKQDGLFAQGSGQIATDYQWRRDIWDSFWIIISIFFVSFFLLSLLLCRIRRNNTRIYRVYKQEQQRGCHFVNYDSDDSGYGEQKTENSRNHWKTKNFSIPDCECYF